MANKALDELWNGYKDARKERGGKLLPKIKKKDMAEMSVRELTILVINKILGDGPDTDKPIKDFSDDEWEDFGNRMEKRAFAIQKEFGLEKLPEEEEQN